MMYFFEKYILLNLEDYFGEGYDMQPMLWLLFLAIGVCFACFALHFVKNTQYSLVKQLLRHKAQDEASAKTLEALGLASRPLLRATLKRGGAIDRVIDRVGEELTYEQYVAMQKDKEARKRLTPDPQTALFYIGHDKRDAAERILAEGSASILRPIAACAAVLLCYLLLALLFPSLLSLLTAL